VPYAVTGIPPLGAFPLALLLPYASLMWTGVLSVIIGLILASAFSAIIVYAQELLPGRVGMVAGMMFGFSFGLGGLGAAALGRPAAGDDRRLSHQAPFLVRRHHVRSLCSTGVSRLCCA
jgi:hypothetical protein